jgi:hypothetical protein
MQGAGDGPVTGRPRSHGRYVATTVAVVALIVGTLGATIATRRSSEESPGSVPTWATGPGLVPPTGLSATSIGKHRLSYRVDEQIDLDAHGKPIPHSRNAMINRNYIARNGDILSIRSGSQNGCFSFPALSSASLTEPNEKFFASLPTVVETLAAYLWNHVSGSSSRYEAVFVAVGDMLRTADGLASPRLRGALVAVLSRTPGVTVHRGQRDQMGRPAIRLDFVDQRIRPGEIHSYYFDPTSFRFLEDREGRNSQPTHYTGPSPAYTAAPTGPVDDPAHLSGPAFVDVLIVEKTVTHLPRITHGCQPSGIPRRRH